MEKYSYYIKKSIKSSIESIRTDYKRYLCFFIAVFIVQVLFLLILATSYNNRLLENRYIREKYDSHVIMRGLNRAQLDYIARINENNTSADIKIVKTESCFNKAIQEYTYDIGIFITGKKPTASFDAFISKYLPQILKYGDPDGSFRYEETPLLNYRENILGNRTRNFFASTALFIFSVLLIITLYSININHYKFQYGILITFGANFKKLFEIFIWELLVISALTTLPALLLSNIMALLFYILRGLRFSFSFLALDLFRN